MDIKPPEAEHDETPAAAERAAVKFDFPRPVTRATVQRGAAIRYRTRGLDLLYDGSRVEGVRARHDGAVHELRAPCVVLACGGFEANAAWRTR